MHKICTLILAGALALTTAYGTTPMRRGYHTYRQADGTTVTLRLYGDANSSYFITRDGLAVLRGKDGNFHYTTTAADGLQSLSTVVHELGERSAAETAAIGSATTAEAAHSLFAQLFPAVNAGSRATRGTADGLGAYGQSASGVVPSIGTITIPVVMAAFSDVDFAEANTPEKISRWLNEVGYNDESHCAGSVRDYFLSQSSGALTVNFEVVAKVKVSNTRNYYGENGTKATLDTNRYAFIQEVLDSAVVAGVDFSKYATDGVVKNVSIFFAGPGEHSAHEDGYENYLWAHFASRSFTTTSGVRIGSYFIGNELLQNYYDADGKVHFSDAGNPIPQSAALDGIGVFCHEFSHALGLPDMYYTGKNETIYDTLRTMDYWSVMDYGQYVQNGYAPIGYSAYERSFMGWLDVKELTEAQAVTLPAFDADSELPKAYCIRNDANTAEYYLLENRQPSTWYPKRMGAGLLITHVDYLASVWNLSSNSVNNDPDHQRYSYVPADGVKDQNTFNDLFDGVSSPTEFSDDSSPASTVFMGSGLGKPIYDIAMSDGVVTFSYLSRGLTAVTAVESAAQPHAWRVYSADGRYVTTVTAADPSTGLAGAAGLRHAGVYIVTDGTTTLKVVLK